MPHAPPTEGPPKEGTHCVPVTVPVIVPVTVPVTEGTLENKTFEFSFLSAR